MRADTFGIAVGAKGQVALLEAGQAFLIGLMTPDREITKQVFAAGLLALLAKSAVLSGPDDPSGPDVKWG